MGRELPGHFSVLSKEELGFARNILKLYGGPQKSKEGAAPEIPTTPTGRR